MRDELLEMVEREVLGWPGVSKQRGEGVAEARAVFGYHQRPSTGLGAGRSGTSTTRVWRTSRSRGRSTTS